MPVADQPRPPSSRLPTHRAINAAELGKWSTLSPNPDKEYGARLAVMGRCLPSLGVFPTGAITRNTILYAVSRKGELLISYTFPMRTSWSSSLIPSLTRLHGEAIVNTELFDTVCGKSIRNSLRRIWKIWDTWSFHPSVSVYSLCNL